jgi:uncharacterized protein YceK
MIRSSFGIAVIFLMAGCASIISSATAKMADNLTQAMLNQNDLETVRVGAPAYLLMLDGMIEGDADNTDLLLAGARLYSSYVTAFIEDEERAKRLADKSLLYAKSALCANIAPVCEALTARAPEFIASLSKASASDVPVLYGFASAWAGWMQLNANDWNALADLPKLTALFERSVELDEEYDHGGAHLYLAVLATQLPPSLGGKPEIGRRHFERAREISSGQNLMVDVLMAQHYARTIFDKELHDQLLLTVQTKPADHPGFTLINTIAKLQAAELLAESDEFF